MRRSICSTESSFSYAGETSTWKFLYTTASPLPKGTKLRFDLLSLGRDSDWEIPQTDVKDKKNLIWGVLPNGKSIEAKSLAMDTDYSQAIFDFALPSEIKVGETFTICIGTPDSDKDSQEKKGNRCQTHVQRKRTFHLFIDPKGKGDFKEPEVFLIDIKGNILHNIRVVTPSLVARNRRFDILVRFEDRYGNPTGNAPQGTLIELSYEHLRDNLNWKLFVPETGFINLPNLYFNEPGIYKIQLLNLTNQTKFVSAPIKCLAETEKSIFWGLFHGESIRYDSTDHIEPLLRHMRDDRALQFYATSSFESIEETSNEAWKLISNQIAEFNEDGRFNTFLGFQWYNDAEGEGLRELVYLKDSKPILRKKDAKSNTLKKMYRSHSVKDFVSMPLFSMAKGFSTDFSDFDPEFERAVEIYNAWGSSECTEKEGNLRPITIDGEEGIEELPKGSIRAALNRGCRFGFVAGGFDDRGVFEGLYTSDQVQYSPGLTAIIGIEHSRDGIVQALHARSCYATTGARIVLGFSIAGASMGSELSTKLKPGLVFNRHITGYACGTAPIKEIAIIRNGHPFHILTPKQDIFDFAFDDTELLQHCILEGTEEKPAFAYYYLRLLQEDGHIAWSSPIWIDFPDIGQQTPLKKPRKSTK
ncbi:MAG: hypothetical protein KGZ30_01895 [Anaplasmataceae bacterium]|nr:hypothetical protein [Anaplasmataceae bacterium]